MPEWKAPLGGSIRSRDKNIKTNLKEIGCEGMEWIRLVRDRDQR